MYLAHLLRSTPDTVLCVFHEKVDSRSARADRTWNLGIVSWPGIRQAHVRGVDFLGDGFQRRFSYSMVLMADTVHTSVHGGLWK